RRDGSSVLPGRGKGSRLAPPLHGSGPWRRLPGRGDSSLAAGAVSCRSGASRELLQTDHAGRPAMIAARPRYADAPSTAAAGSPPKTTWRQDTMDDSGDAARARHEAGTIGIVGCGQ